jgi:hypothetical protein
MLALECVGDPFPLYFLEQLESLCPGSAVGDAARQFVDAADDVFVFVANPLGWGTRCALP